MTKRLGLCCLFKQATIKFRTTTVRYLVSLSEKGEDPLEHIATIIESNLENLLLAVNFCSDNGIGAFRINSGLLPIYTHPTHGYSLEQLSNCDKIEEKLASIKKCAHEKNIRLTFHPDQFVVLNSPKEEVVEKSIADLEYHTMLSKRLGADVINIHCGGGYGDKPLAIKRFAKNFQRLSKGAKARLTIENDDKIFTPEELLPLCHELKIPFVYDVHHHRCLPDALTVLEATREAVKTWNREPLFHLSSPKEGWGAANPRFHHDFIYEGDLPEEWRNIDPLTIDVEAKAKEVAVLQLRSAMIKDGWNL